MLAPRWIRSKTGGSMQGSWIATPSALRRKPHGLEPGGALVSRWVPCGVGGAREYECVMPSTQARMRGAGPRHAVDRTLVLLDSERMDVRMEVLRGLRTYRYCCTSGRIPERDWGVMRLEPGSGREAAQTASACVSDETLRFTIRRNTGDWRDCT